MPAYREMTKGQRRRLRELAGVAHERELDVALASLERDFARWRAGELSAFELNDSIHRFHQGPSRDLYKYYDGDPDFPVVFAFVRGILTAADLGPELLELLASHIRLTRERHGTE